MTLGRMDQKGSFWTSGGTVPGVPRVITEYSCLYRNSLKLSSSLQFEEILVIFPQFCVIYESLECWWGLEVWTVSNSLWSSQIIRCLSPSWCPVGQARVSMVGRLGWALWCRHVLRAEGWASAWSSTSSLPHQLRSWILASEKDPT